MTVSLLALSILLAASSSANSYPWADTYCVENAFVQRIAPPEGFVRLAAESASFEDWLRHLPLKTGFPPVVLYSGALKNRQDVHFAVVDIDVGTKNLQQCADAVIRLRAEYLFSIGDCDAIAFHLTNGDLVGFAQWRAGLRPTIRGGKCVWKQQAQPSKSHETFRKYLDMVFMYAGTLSLSKELMPVADLSEMKIGDVFIDGGSPGHAVIVVDMAINPQNGKKLFVLAQSYMPAQDIHILRNPFANPLSPWYPLDFGGILETPEWSFGSNDLKRFENPRADNRGETACYKRQ